MTLHNITLYLQGLELNWYSIYPNKIDLRVNETAIFKINYVILDSAEIKKYPINILIKSDELEKNIYLTLNVIKVLDKTELKNKLDILEKQINDLENEINNLRDKDFPVDSLYTLLYDAKRNFELARTKVESDDLKEASELTKYVEIIVNDIKEILSENKPIQVRVAWSLLLTITVIIILLILSLKFSKTKIIKLFKRRFKL